MIIKQRKCGLYSILRSHPYAHYHGETGLRTSEEKSRKTYMNSESVMNRWELQSQQPAFLQAPINFLLAVSSLYHNLRNQHGPQALRIFSFTSLPSHFSHFSRKTSAIRDGRTEFRKRYQITQISRVATIWSNTFHRT